MRIISTVDIEQAELLPMLSRVDLFQDESPCWNPSPYWHGKPATLTVYLLSKWPWESRAE